MEEMLSRFDFLLNKGQAICFMGEGGAVFLRQFKLDSLSRQSKNIGTLGGI